MDNNQSATIPDASQLNASGGADNVSEETVSLFELVNKELGTEYKDDDAALAGLKQTKSYVGRVGQVMPYLDKATEKGIPHSKIFEAMDNIVNGQPVAAPAASPVDTSKFVTKDEIAREFFYKDNPLYKEYQPVIDAVAQQTGKTPAEVVTTDSFKAIFEKAKGFDEVQKTKSVLQSNPRLGVASDNLTKAQDAIKNSAPQHVVDDLAVKAVLEAYDLK